MSNRLVIVALVIALVALALFAFFSNSEELSGFTAGRDAGAARVSEGMWAETSAIVANDQRGGGKRVQISSAVLAVPGYVVVHESERGAPGKILGASSYLTAGTHASVGVVLERAPEPETTLYAMLHVDNGNGSFNAADDTPAMSALGGPLMMQFRVLPSLPEKSQEGAGEGDDSKGPQDGTGENI